MSVFSVSDISELEDNDNEENFRGCYEYVNDADLGSEQFYKELQKMELNIKYYSLQAAMTKCKQSLLQLRAKKRRKRSSNSSNVPDGQTIVRNTERQPPTDNSSAAGASSNQRQYCPVCDFPVNLFCGRCGVTPHCIYCSPRCQESNWLERVRDVHQNLISEQEENNSQDNYDADLAYKLQKMELNIKYYSHQAEIVRCKQSLLQLRANKRRNSQISSSNSNPVFTNTERQPPTDNSSASGTSTLPTLLSRHIKKCLLCDSVAKFHCGSCKIAPYCSLKCQHADWLGHRDLCNKHLPISPEAPARPQSPADRNRGNNSDGTRMMEEEENPEEERPIVQSIESQQDDEDWD